MDHLKTQRQLKAALQRMKSPRKRKLVTLLMSANLALMDGKKIDAIDFMRTFNELLETAYFSIVRDGPRVEKVPEVPNQFKDGTRLRQIVRLLRLESDPPVPRTPQMLRRW